MIKSPVCIHICFFTDKQLSATSLSTMTTHGQLPRLPQLPTK
jgi:hypothetical protein